ncbi:hypothetical protein HMI54_008521 [Coelomomyces lativittatus]|nr:hypothetical protein HMI54_008521 [Coelomomyces lativittatus]
MEPLHPFHYAPSSTTSTTSNSTSIPSTSSPDYHLPSCYQVPMPSPLDVMPKFHQFSDETLFYLFYAQPRDQFQLWASMELYQRNWRFHKDLKLWLTKYPTTESAYKTPHYERGMFIFFDIATWEKTRKEYTLYYDCLEDPPHHDVVGLVNNSTAPAAAGGGGGHPPPSMPMMRMMNMATSSPPPLSSSSTTLLTTTTTTTTTTGGGGGTEKGATPSSSAPMPMVVGAGMAGSTLHEKNHEAPLTSMSTSGYGFAPAGSLGSSHRPMLGSNHPYHHPTKKEGLA